MSETVWCLKSISTTGWAKKRTVFVKFVNPVYVNIEYHSIYQTEIVQRILYSDIQYTILTLDTKTEDTLKLL